MAESESEQAAKSAAAPNIAIVSSLIFILSLPDL
jgi:hypothetical protein